MDNTTSPERHNDRVRLDHVSYACGPDGLAPAESKFADELSVHAVPGGVHPAFGTTNAVVPLANHTYVELVGVLEHPAADKAPFGRAVKARGAGGGGWLGWVVAVDDIGVIEQRLGRPSVPGHRVRPDGYDLRWRQIGVESMLAHPELPFFIQWESDVAEHPSVAPSNGSAPPDATLARIELSGDRQGLERWIGEPLADVLGGIELAWVDGPPGVVSVHVDTPDGSVKI
jgi:hypothetical protein